eukprot:m.45491 g.45491  ORF g.45491 m.45491 type:complete len:106 (+) comp33609_c0_seq1:269-586(+)
MLYNITEVTLKSFFTTFPNGYYNRSSFIIAKHPMAGSVDDFWKVVFQIKSVTVVDLTEIKENPHYWPDSNPVTYGGIAIELESLLDMSGYFARTMTVKKGWYHEK